MKGIVFTEFIEMVEERYGLEVADRMISRAKIASRGAYTAVGTYNPREMVSLLGQLCAETGVAIPDLLRTFGEYLFKSLATTYPQLLQGTRSAFGLLARIEDVIHPEVRKLYPDAELPHFETRAQSGDQLVMIYRSPRGLADLADGLIQGCARWYGEEITVVREDLSGGGHTHELFTLTRRS